ncbi:hypothetical protein MMC26_006796 [Xylographa opegraphella]|nr:hypothetical protein [Xylographa opegraphella]
MENTIDDSLDRNEIPSETTPAALEAPPPTTNQAAGANPVRIPVEVLMFLNEFFLAMQIPPTVFTDDQEHVYRHSQAVLLRTLIEAHRVERRLGRFANACIELARVVEERSHELNAREHLAAQVHLARARENEAIINRIQTVSIRVEGERFGARLRRAGEAVRSIFRRSRRQAEQDSDDENWQFD